jgi:DNA-binding CsgD family transcriptional regulator
VPPSLMLAPTPTGPRRLVGRRDLLATSLEHLAAGTSVVLVGRHGSGRTRLLAELRRRHPGPAIALCPDRETAAADLGALVVAMPELGDVADRPLQGARRAVVRGLRSAAAGRRLLLTVDDAELLDPATAAGLREVVDGLSWCSVVFAVLPDTRADAPAPAVAYPSCRELAIEPLAPADVRTLAAGELGGPLDGTLAAELARRSGGIPAAVLELLRGAQETGAVAFDGEVWRGETPLPAHRLVALDGRPPSEHDALAPELREDLEVLSIAGPLPERVVAALISDGRARRLLATGRVAWSPAAGGRQLTITDALDAEIVRAGLDADRRRQRLARLLGALGRAGGAPLGTLRVGRWWLEVGGGDHELLGEAARLAYTVGDYALAGRLAEGAVARGGGARATIAAGAAAVELGRTEEGERLLMTAIATATDEVERAWATIALAHARGVRRGSWDEARRLLATHRDEVTDPVVRLDLGAYRTFLAAAEGQVETARSGLRQQLAVGHGHDVRSDRAALLLAAAAALLVEEAPNAPEVDAALAGAHDLDRTATSALPLGPELVRSAPLPGRVEPDVRLAVAREELAAALARRAADAAGWWALLAGQAALLVGRIRDAEDHLGDAVRSLDGADPLGLRPMAVVHLARARALGGASEGARRTLASLAAGRCRAARTATWIAVTTAVLVAAEGGPDAGPLARQAGEQAAAERRWNAAQVAAELLVALGDGPGASRLLDRVADHVPPTQVAAVHDAAHALAEGTSTGLEAAARRLAAGGRRQLAAEVAGHAVARGAGPRAHALCRGLATTCDGAWLLQAGRLRPVVLPARCRAVARAAAAGRGTARLAADLGVSPRTIEHHLGRAYRDLGVVGRRELAELYPPELAPLAPA